MRRKRILIVDDDVAIIKFVRASLEANYYEPLVAMDGAEALRAVEREMPDLVILDIMMPKVDGVEVCRQLREWSQIPIIMLTAKGDEEDKVKCLDLGADDYINKPFSIKELLSRVRAVLRRTKDATTPPTPTPFTSGDLSVYFAERRVTVAGREVKLTPTEYSVLQELVLNAGKVLTHNMLLTKIWGQEYMNENHLVHVFISRLRKKIEPNLRDASCIHTVPGAGYRFEHREE